VLEMAMRLAGVAVLVHRDMQWSGGAG